MPLTIYTDIIDDIEPDTEVLRLYPYFMSEVYIHGHGIGFAETDGYSYGYRTGWGHADGDGYQYD